MNTCCLATDDLILFLFLTLGHGRDINWKSAAPLVADMLEHLKVAQDSVLHAQVRKPRKATFRCACIPIDQSDTSTFCFISF